MSTSTAQPTAKALHNRVMVSIDQSTFRSATLVVAYTILTGLLPFGPLTIHILDDQSTFLSDTLVVAYTILTGLLPFTPLTILILDLLVAFHYSAYKIYTLSNTISTLSGPATRESSHPRHGQKRRLSLQARRPTRHIASLNTSSLDAFLTLNDMSIDFSAHTPTRIFVFRANSAPVIQPVQRGTIETSLRPSLRSAAEDAEYPVQLASPPPFTPLLTWQGSESSNTIDDPSCSAPLTPSQQLRRPSNCPTPLANSSENANSGNHHFLSPSPKLLDGSEQQTPHPTLNSHSRHSFAAEVVTESTQPPRLRRAERFLRYLSLRNNEIDDRRRGEQRQRWKTFVASAGRVVQKGAEQRNA